MLPSKNAIQRNLRTRLELLRCALFHRYIYASVANIARGFGFEYQDVVGDIQPLQFARHLRDRTAAAPGPQLDFAGALGSPSDFTPPGEPDFYNSEPTVSRFLGEVVFTKNPRTVVELGCFVGWTSAHLAYALKARSGAGRLYCVDSSSKYLEVAAANLKRLGLEESTTLIQGKSLDANVLSSLPEKIDLLFIDTSHLYPETLNEITEYARRTAPDGLIALHDSISWPGVRRSLAELGSKFRILTFATERGNGVSVLLNPQAVA